MQYVLPWSSWGPVRPACRWSVVKRRPPTRRSVRWTTSSSPSRSSSAPTTSPKPPSSWSPSPPAKKNSDPPAGQVHRAGARLRTRRKEQKLTAGNRWSGRWKKYEDGKRKGDESSGRRDVWEKPNGAACFSLHSFSSLISLFQEDLLSSTHLNITTLHRQTHNSVLMVC